jgi:riboflavin biosynthesis pyrimidine reductase
VIPSLELLWEAERLPAFDLPEELEHSYGGAFGLEPPLLYANFVETLDGVVAIRSEPLTNRLVSGDSRADRFVMGLLRACADCVLLGSGTLHGSPKSIWTAERAYPDGADAFAKLRQRLGLRPEPELAVLTATGALEPTHPALERGAVVLTTEDGAARSRRSLPAAIEVVVLAGDSVVDPAEAVAVLRERGRSSILSEAGPTVFASLLAAGLVDELFLTVSPLLAGRSPLGGRLGLVEGEELLPERAVPGRLLGVRRDGAHLFLRYALGANERAGP